jgi:hypothetical protein
VNVSHTRATAIVSGLVLAAIVALSLASGNSADGTQPDRSDVESVQAAADRFTPQQISDAWTQITLGNADPLTTIRRPVPLRYRSAHREGDAVIISFTGRHGGCVDIVSRPDRNHVRTRTC